MIEYQGRRYPGLTLTRSARRKVRRSARGLRPWIEGLEDRVVLSTITWDSTNHPVGGSWNVASNWIGGQVPGASDDAVINLTSAGTVTLGASASNAVRSLTTNANTSLSITSDTLSIDSTTTPSTIGGSLTLSGGTLTGAGTLTVSGATTWTGGTMSGAGKTVAEGGLTIGGTDNGYYEYLDGRRLDNLADATLAIKPGYGGGLYVSSGATIDNPAGASFSFIADASILNNGSGGGTFVNDGSLAKSGGTGASVIYIALSNSGAIQAASGTLSLQGTFSNFSTLTRTLTGGSYVVSATLQFDGADIVTNAASISLSGAASKIVDNPNNDGLRNFATNAAAGAFSIQGGRDVTTPGAFSNAGSLTVGSGSTFTATGAYTQSGGSTNLASGGILTSTTANVAIDGGRLGGTGQVNGNVHNAGQVAPGGVGGVGVLGINGSYTQTSGGTLAIELGGPNPGTGYDQLDVSGQANLAGTLAVDLIDGFAPGDGATFQVLNYNPHVGQFETIITQNLPAGTSLSTDYLASDLVLTADVAPVLTSIAITPADPSLPVGLTEAFIATGTYSDGSTANLTNLVTWASADASVASISNTMPTQGVALGLAPGSTTITATLDGLSDHTTLTVTPAVLLSIAVTPAGPNVAKGLTEAFTATGTYSDSSKADLTAQVTWASANPAIATIDASGLATAVGQGATQIGATLGSVVGTTTLTVTPALLTSIAVTPASPSLAKGLAQQFNATGTYTDSSTADITGLVTWASSETGVASITTSGYATAKAVGTSSITATLGTISGSTTITVTPAALVSIAVTPADPSIPKGETVSFEAVGTYTDSTTQDLTTQVTWASSDVAVATISDSAPDRGLATGLGKGTTTITATLGSVNGSTTLAVDPAALVSIAVTPADPSLAKGLGEAFTATGTYSDSSTVDLTSQVTWASANPSVASITAWGFASALSQGTSTITATLGSVNGSTTLTVNPAALVSIDVTPASPSVSAGTTVPFTATGTYTDSTTQDLTTQVTWASSDVAIATISNASPTQGVATGLAHGTTAITATLGSVVGSTILTVASAALVSIDVAPSGSSLAKGQAEPFTATGHYTDGSTADLTTQVTWASSDTATATISNAPGTRGVATALAVGSTTITATSGSVVGSTTLTVTPAILTTIVVTPASPSVAKGLSESFSAIGVYTDATQVDLTTQVTWASSDVAVATISDAPGSQGVASTLAQGTTTITATWGTVLGTGSLTVNAAALVTIAISPTDPSIDAGTTEHFVATGTYTDASTADVTDLVTWSSSKPSVATVSNAPGTQGVASAIAAGSTTITAMLQGVSDSTTLTVVAPLSATITDVSVSWGAAGTSTLQTADDGLRLLPAGRNTDLPWYGINKISITLSKPEALSAGDVAVIGRLGIDYGPVTISGSGTSYVITLARPINQADRITLTIGNAGIATFTRRLDVLPGDVNDDGLVTMQDALIERNGYLGFGVVPVPLVFLDVLGDGKPDLDNYHLIRRLMGAVLP